MILTEHFCVVQVIVVDELASSADVAAVKSVAQRGTIMVASVHGLTIQGLLKNPELNTLLGGIHDVTLGDSLAW